MQIKLLSRNIEFRSCSVLEKQIWFDPVCKALVSRFDWVGPRILRPAPLIPVSGCLLLFSASQHLLSLPLICLLICASDLSAWNRFSPCSPSGNLEWGWPNLARAKQSLIADLMYFDAFFSDTLSSVSEKKKHTHIHTNIYVCVVLCLSSHISSLSPVSILKWHVFQTEDLLNGR